MNTKRFFALCLALVLCLSPLASVADTYDVGQGDVTVTASGDTQTVTGYNSDKQQDVVDYPDPDPVITGTSTGADAHTVTIEAEAGATASVTFQDLNIDTRNDPTNLCPTGNAAVVTSGAGAVVIELNDESSLTSGYSHAGLEKGNDGSLTIQDENNDGGSLTASGGYYAAGIGGGNYGSGSQIKITGGEVNATGGECGAGIGGGSHGDGKDIFITGGTVTAVGGNWAAGIGGGAVANGDHIEISGGTVIATGGETAAGIGAGDKSIDGEGGKGTNITISGSAQVSAAGGAEDAWGFGTGAAIGNAGERDEDHNPVAGAEAEDTGELHTEGLYTTGSISYYPAGTTAEQIQNKEVAPEKTVKGEAHDPKAPVKENEIPAQVGVEGGYDLVVYCADCGEELSREHVVIPALPEPEEDAFAAACFDLARRIREAPEKGTVEADMRLYPGLSRAVLEALRDRPDVTLTVTCRLNRAATELVIPAGLDLVTPLGRGFSLTFAEIAKLIG